MDEKINILRHSMAHVMAKAVLKLYPQAVLTIGPAIDNGFYYDFDNVVFANEDIAKIEKEMKNIIAKGEKFERKVLSKQEAKQMFSNNPYKLEIIDELPENEEVSVYYLGNDFVDLCRGPHVEHSGKLSTFGYKINRISGAYWRGSEKNKMLQRIYAYGFETKQELADYIKMMEEAEKRDHRKLGKELGLFMISPYAPGMPFYLPKGMILKNELIAYWREMHKQAGYVEIETPIAMNKQLWEVSGHWEHYRKNMYTFKTEDEEFAIKPMNCPGGILVYKENIHSYKDLPLRVGELGKVHRQEASGTLHGLFRVRCFTQDDAHIFMLPSQIEQEIKGVLQLVDKMYKVFNLEYHLELSTMPEDHIGDVKDWEMAETGLKNALTNLGKEFVINEGDGAFYGPKIDIHIKDAIGRTWQCGTIQLDMQLPKRFEIEYIDEDGQKKEPIMIHRVVYGSIDRFIGIITENYAGAFPAWLAPVQVIILPISEKFLEPCKQIKQELEKHNIRVELDDRNEKIGYKIRQAQMQKIPYSLIIGENEINNNTVNVRQYGKQESQELSLSEFIQNITEQIVNKQ